MATRKSGRGSIATKKAGKSIGAPPAQGPAGKSSTPQVSYSLTLPLGRSIRAVYDRLSQDALNSFVGVTPKPATTDPAEDVARLQVRRQGRWVVVRQVGGEFDLGRPPAPGPLLPQPAPVAALALETAPQALSAPIEGLPQPDMGDLSTRLSAVRGATVSNLKRLVSTVSMQMDPRLQLAVINRRSGKQSAAISSATGDEVPVIARVRSYAEWESIADVHPGANLGDAPDGTILVTGRVPVDRIEVVRASPTIVSMKASQPVHTALAKTVETMAVSQNLLPANVKPGGGKGVVVGIVDTGGDFAHANFRNADGSSRLLGLWHQAGVAKADSPFGYGRLYSPAEINASLATADPYASLGYGPRPDGPNEQGMHGTHVMDIAAGNGLGTTLPGVAPQADIVFVEMAATDIAWRGPDVVKQSFGDSAQMLEAVKFIFELAGDRPCVVNLSLGTNGGPHDGTSLVEQGMDALVNEKPNRAVVIAASNSQGDGIHTGGQIPAGGTVDLGWSLLEEAGGEFELWYAGDARLEVSLIGPDGTVAGTVQPGNSLPLAFGGKVVIFISNRLDDPNNHCNVIGIWIADGLDGGVWTVRLRCLSPQAIDYHAWIERLDGSQSSFVAPVPTHTLGSISTGQQTVVVGSYDAHKAGFPLSSFSSSGPTRDGREKPEISAPGGNVIAARSRTGNGVTRKSGTSMAAPAVTGLIALMLAEAKRKGVSLSSTALRAKLVAGVDLVAPGAPWDARSGHGRASSKAI